MRRKIFSPQTPFVAFRIKTIFVRLFNLLRSPVFWMLTILGNAFIFLAAYGMYLLEGPNNIQAARFMNCLIWAFGMVTTVGATELHPQSFAGQCLMILMMIGGAVFLWSYMTIFIATLVGPELNLIEKEVSELQKTSKVDEKELLQKIQLLINQMGSSQVQSQTDESSITKRR